jgi:hypothetical protein
MLKSLSSPPSRRVTLIQQGARRNYIYARQLEDAGLLKWLVTDAALPESGTNMATQLVLSAFPRLRGPLSRRTVEGIPANRLKPSFLPNVASFVARFMPEESRFEFMDEALAWRCRLRGLRDADILVNYRGNGGSFLDYAKRKGVRIVTDFVITPKHLEIEQAERDRWPGWDDRRTSQRVMPVIEDACLGWCGFPISISARRRRWRAIWPIFRASTPDACAWHHKEDAASSAQVTSMNDWFNGAYAPDQLVRANPGRGGSIRCPARGNTVCNPFVELTNNSGGTFGNIIPFGHWSSYDGASRGGNLP